MAIGSKHVTAFSFAYSGFNLETSISCRDLPDRAFAGGASSGIGGLYRQSVMQFLWVRAIEFEFDCAARMSICADFIAYPETGDYIDLFVIAR